MQLLIECLDRDSSQPQKACIQFEQLNIPSKASALVSRDRGSSVVALAKSKSALPSLPWGVPRHYITLQHTKRSLLELENLPHKSIMLAVSKSQKLLVYGWGCSAHSGAQNGGRPTPT